MRIQEVLDELVSLRVPDGIPPESRWDTQQVLTFQMQERINAGETGELAPRRIAEMLVDAFESGKYFESKVIKRR